MDKDNNVDTKDNDEMDMDDNDTEYNDEMDADDDELDTDDDEMDTENDDKMYYKTKVFDGHYIRFDYPANKDNIIYINASGASYDVLEFLNYYDDSDIGLTVRLCMALQIKKWQNAINQKVFNDEHDKVILLHLYRV